MSWFTPEPIVKYKVVEVEKPRKALPLDGEMKDVLRSLPNNPGFAYLLDKLRLQRSVLETQLRNTRMESLRDVEFVQSGIFWTQWLEQQIHLLTLQPARPQVEPTEPELFAFNEIDTLLERVGVSPTTSGI